MRNKYLEYYSLLGLTPGADADEVKKAFRTKIKQHHPDTSRTPEESESARQLIEAYHALKKGPPADLTRHTSGPTSGVRRPAAQPAAQPATNHDAGRPAAGQAGQRPGGYERTAGIFRFGKDAGQRIYEEAFGKTGGKPDVNHYWDILSQMVYGGDEETSIYGENIDVREYVHNRPRPGAGRPADPGPGPSASPLPGSLDQAVMYYNRAEKLLRDVVGRYDDGRGLKKKVWIREYLAGLNNVQILFRDVANRHPVLSSKALNRVQQIKELSSEIRRML